jgi:thiosulfate/3-mercaptopyruvate sulfurtransferase
MDEIEFEKGQKMKNILARSIGLLALVLSLAIIPAAQAAPAPCGAHGDKNTMLVSTSWLADHLKDPNLVVIVVQSADGFVKAHIPGAVSMDFMDSHLMTGPTGLTMELPPMSQLAETFGKLGVTNDSHIILYQAGESFAATARVYLTLDAMGLGAQTSLLDGGFLQWTKEGRAVSTESRKVKPGVVTPCPKNDVITDISYVSANMHHPGVAIVDARLAEFYTGATQPDKQRLGHIPGAGNLPYTTLTDSTGKLKSREELAELFRNAGVKPGDHVVVYCHIGQQASAAYFAARYLGYDVRLYDGSWEDWSAHKDLPAETSPGVTVKQ